MQPMVLCCWHSPVSYLCKTRLHSLMLIEVSSLGQIIRIWGSFQSPTDCIPNDFRLPTYEHYIGHEVTASTHYKCTTYTNGNRFVFSSSVLLASHCVLCGRSCEPVGAEPAISLHWFYRHENL